MKQCVNPDRVIREREYNRISKTCRKLGITPLSLKLLRTRQKKLNKSKYHSEMVLEKLIKKHCVPMYRKNYPCLNIFFGDFVFTFKKVILEADGSSHDDRKEYDERRDLLLQSAGYKIYRFSTKEIPKWKKQLLPIIDRHKLHKPKEIKEKTEETKVQAKEDKKTPIFKRSWFVQQRKIANAAIIEDLNQRRALFNKQLAEKRKK